MAVAAAIGVGAEDPLSGGQPGLPTNGNNALSQRLSNKMKMMQGTGLGEINRSIEKMSIGSTAGNYAPAGVTSNPHCGMPMTQTSVPLSTNNTTRRGSNWTNSTEGYGSMRSEQSMMSSRRCSDVSAMSQVSQKENSIALITYISCELHYFQGSNVSTRAMMNSPWDPMSADSSRRSSMASNHGGNGIEPTPQPGIGQHLNRLHRRAQQQQMMPTGTPSATPTMEMGRRGSDMTTPTNPHMPIPHQQPPMPHQQGHNVRRASDPVRTLDRNFGTHQRRGSYNNQMNMSGHPQQRVPLHGQRIRGMSGDTYFHQQPVMVSYLEFLGIKEFSSNKYVLLLQPQSNPSMYPSQRMAGNGSFLPPNQGTNQFQQQAPPPAYNNNQMPTNQQPNYPGWTANQQCPVGQQGFGQQSANFPGYPNAVQSGNNNFAEYNNGQWSTGQHQWNGWNPAATPVANPAKSGQGQAQGAQPSAPGPNSTAVTSASSCDNSSNSYQRTFDYVQQCQTWTAQ